MVPSANIGGSNSGGGSGELPRACDRCHALKERCRWKSSTAVACDRCTRLQHVCRNERPMRRPGRKPRRDDSATAQSTGLGQSSAARHATTQHNHSAAVPGVDDSPTLTVEKPASPPDALFDTMASGEERQSSLRALQRMFVDDKLMNNFLIGRDFYDRHHSFLKSQFFECHSIMRDAFLACALAWAAGEQEERHQLDLSAVCYKRASSALSTLRNFEVDNVSQMVDCLTLGGLCVTIAMKLGPSQIALISNKTLEMIRPIYNQQDVVDPDRLALLTCLIFTDLEDSLIRCRLPTLRYKLPNDRQYVDRYVGLCHSLLPHLHDIAEFATALRHADDTDVLSIHQALVSVAESVIDWRSSPPTDLLKRFSGAEVSHLICQEHVLRAMALLIIHRLCHPFGVADEQAQLMANQILAQLESTAQITGSLTLLTELALFAACMELRQGDHRFDRMCLWLKGDEQLRDRLTAGMEFVRATRDASGTVYWHDLGVIVGNL